MLVLKFIGILLVMFLVAVLVGLINRYTEKKYDYEFFNVETYGVSAVGYIALYYGHQWHQDALNHNLDVLNGQIIMGLGVVLIVGVLYYNTKKTSVLLSLALSVVQQVLYAALAVVGFLALIMIMAFFMQTKPVYSINGR